MSGIIYKINKLLEAKSLKKQAFADKIGISRDTVYNCTELKEQCQEYREIIKNLTKSLNAVTDELKNKR